MTVTELIFPFEYYSSSQTPGKILVPLDNLWHFPHLPVGEWYICLNYILFTNRERFSKKNFKIVSPQVRALSKQHLLLALVEKDKKEDFYVFSTNEKSVNFKQKISHKTSPLELDLFIITDERRQTESEDLFEADVRVGFDISIPYGY